MWGRRPHAAMVLLALLLVAASVLACARASADTSPTPTASTQPDGASPTDAAMDGSPGVSDDAILFGQSAAFSGPAQDLGSNMNLGILAAFHERNLAGGVHGRQLELTSLDDAYEPEAAALNTAALIEDQDVFALIGAVGTPTSRSAVPVAHAAEVPYIAPFTGAEFLRDEQLTNVINVRASYYQETEEMVERLTTDLGITRIAVMYQDDSYGRAGYNGARQALERRGMEPVAIGVYPRNTISVKTALIDLQQGNPEAVIMIGAYKPVSTLVLWARHIGLDSVFMTVSFVGSNALARELNATGEVVKGVYVTQVVPFPTDDTIPVVRAYQDALAAYEPNAVPGFVSLEGYLAGLLAIAGLEACGREVDRQCFLDALHEPSLTDISGFALSLDADDNQGSDAVFLTTIGSDGQYHPQERLSEATP